MLNVQILQSLTSMINPDHLRATELCLSLIVAAKSTKRQQYGMDLTPWLFLLKWEETFYHFLDVARLRKIHICTSAFKVKL